MAVHRRGGKHAVKDTDLTHTQYDDYSREQLLEAVKEAGCYVKDDKKSVMARKLADHDQSMKREEIKAQRERKEMEERQQQEFKDAAEARRARRRARAERNRDRYMRRGIREDVSSNSDDTEDVDERNRIDAHKLTVTGGAALSDETWEDTCSETTVRSVNPRVTPSCRLQLFEWSYIIWPSAHPPEDSRFEKFPMVLTYTPMKLITMHTAEKVALPGSKYPTGVVPDFVPILDPLTRLAARHGHTIGLLAHATIERATSWAQRTIIPGWNGRMYFGLPQHDAKEAQLNAVFSKWNNANSKLLHLTPGATEVRTDRTRRFAQRLTNKRRKTTEVYEASKWRPLALAYMPAYLDWEPDLEYEECHNSEHRLTNLFYIRFPGCDLPHYYFWVKNGEWSDPTTQDPYWNPEISEQHDSVDLLGISRPQNKSRVRVRNITAPPAHDDGDSEGQDADFTATIIEYDLITRGVSETLSRSQSLASSIGAEHAWSSFARRLVSLYPSGELPWAPPVQGKEDVCLAEKIVGLLSGREVPPFTGEESWTRNDDEFWDVVSVVSSSSVCSFEEVISSTESVAASSQPIDARLPTSSDRNEKANTHALHRRDSVDTPLHRRESTPTIRPTKDVRVLSWLDTIDTIYPPCIVPLTSSCALDEQHCDAAISPSSLDVNIAETAKTCPFCSAPWQDVREIEKAAHMLSHSAPALNTARPAPSQINAMGRGAKRRESLLSLRTLQSYHFYANGGTDLEDRRGKKRKMGMLQRVNLSLGGVLERRASTVRGLGNVEGGDEDTKGWDGDDESDEENGRKARKRRKP